MRVTRIVPYAMIALALSAMSALAQVGEADKCLKVHSTACKKSPGGNHSMGFVIQNTCERDVLAFVRKQSYSASQHGEPGYWRSFVRLYQPRKNLRRPKYQGNGTTACLKKPRWAYCAEYKPANFKELTDDYTNPAPYMKMLREKSACFREITKEPFVHDGHKFLPSKTFSAGIPDGDQDKGGTKYLRFRKAPTAK